MRIKGTVVASFDQFVIKGADCGNQRQQEHLALLSGRNQSQGGSGSHGANTTGAELYRRHSCGSGRRSRWTRTRNSSSSIRSCPRLEKGGMCLGCNKFEVTATLVGRLDAVEKAGLQRDKAGKIIGFGGFGHMNAYQARLVLESVSDVTSKEIDYSKTQATKDDNAPAPSGLLDARFEKRDQLAVVRKLVASFAPGVTAGVQLNGLSMPMAMGRPQWGGNPCTEPATKPRQNTKARGWSIPRTACSSLAPSIRIAWKAMPRAGLMFLPVTIRQPAHREPGTHRALRSGESRLDDNRSGRLHQQAENIDAAGRIFDL